MTDENAGTGLDEVLRYEPSRVPWVTAAFVDERPAALARWLLYASLGLAVALVALLALAKLPAVTTVRAKLSKSGTRWIARGKANDDVAAKVRVGMKAFADSASGMLEGRVIEPGPRTAETGTAAEIWIEPDPSRSAALEAIGEAQLPWKVEIGSQPALQVLISGLGGDISGKDR